MIKVYKRCNFNTNGVLFDFTFQNGKYKGNFFSGYLEVCTDPCCRCHRADFTIHRMGTKIPLSERIQWKFTLDLDEKQVVGINAEEGHIFKTKNFAEIFINEITEKNWKELIDEFNCYKAYISDYVDLDDIKIEIDFSKTRIKHDGDKYYYYQLFPFCMDYFFSNNRYTIDDKYCMDPECSCTEAEVTITPCEPDGPDDEFLTDDEMIIKYNYLKNNWEVIQKSSEKAHDLNKIVPLMVKSIPDFDKILRKRHIIMRGIYLKNKNKNNSRQIKNKLKIGRNVPCPCGSEKKYKKCCGK